MFKAPIAFILSGATELKKLGFGSLPIIMVGSGNGTSTHIKISVMRR